MVSSGLWVGPPHILDGRYKVEFGYKIVFIVPTIMGHVDGGVPPPLPLGSDPDQDRAAFPPKTSGRFSAPF